MELFYQDNKMEEFTANVIKCNKKKEFYEVVLDKTAFYPEGGGQPGDIGFLNDVEVLDTIIVNGEICHIIKSELSGEVSGRLDFNRRFRIMQNHSGEHILSGLLKSVYGAKNVGFNMCGECVTIDIDKQLNHCEIQHIESLANQKIYENIEIKTTIPDKEALAKIDYRSKTNLDSGLRIVTIEGADICACCGVHCSYSGEIGIIKIIDYKNYKGGMRISLKCGFDALEDYADKNVDIYKLVNEFSVKPNEVYTAVIKQKAEMLDIKQKLNIARNEILMNKVDKIPQDNTIIAFEDLEKDEILRYAKYLNEKCETTFVFSKDGDVHRYVISSKETDLREITASLNKKFNGRGGGKPNLTQGSLHATIEELESFINYELKQ